MNAEKFNRILSVQTATARKVFDCVPIETSWSLTQIVAELARSGIRPGIKIVHGCLNCLKEDGLVKESSGQRFTRARPSQSVTQSAQIIDIARQEPPLMLGSETTSNNPSPATTAEQPSPMSRLEILAVRLRGVGKDLLAVADEIDDCIIDLQQQSEGMLEKIEKAKQLQKLLKEF